MLGTQCRRCYEEVRSADVGRGEAGGLSPKKVLGMKASALLWVCLVIAAMVGGFGAECSSSGAVSVGNGVMALLAAGLIFAYRGPGVGRRIIQGILAVVLLLFCYLAYQPGPSMGVYEVVGTILEALAD